ncbi:MAG: RNA polymerase sigma factor [Planctomycetota bacterium]
MIGRKDNRYSGLSEARLVANICRRDAAALREFHDRFFRHLYNFVFFRVGCRHPDTEDIVQEVMMAAIRGMPGFAQRSSLFSWLCGIARNKIAQLHAKQTKTSTIETVLSNVDGDLDLLLQQVDRSPLPLEVIEKDEVRNMVGAAMASLQPAYRLVLDLKYISGLPVKEIADQLNKTPKAVESTLTRAREAFQKVFKLIVKGHIELAGEGSHAQ